MYKCSSLPVASFTKLTVSVQLSLLLKINHIPTPAKIIKTDKKKNDCAVVVVACSATESTNGSDVVKNGFNAFRYL